MRSKSISAIGYVTAITFLIAVFGIGSLVFAGELYSGKWAGKTLRVSHSAGTHTPLFEDALDEFAQRTGAKVVPTPVPADVEFTKYMIELSVKPAAFDVVSITAMVGGDLQDVLLSLDEYIEETQKSDPEWDYSDFIVSLLERSFRVGGERKAVQFDADATILGYRKDLFEHPEEKSAFKERYGYELAPPETWEQYLDIAEFFTRKSGEKLAGETLEKPLYGTIELCTKWGAHWWFLIRYASYCGPNFDYFDPDTMEPLINSPAGVKALQNMVKSMEYTPPGSMAYQFYEFTTAWTLGRVAMEISFPDFGQWAKDPETSTIMGKAAFALPPGATVDGKLYRRSWNLWPLGLAIPKHAREPDMAWDFIQFFTGKERLTKNCLGMGWGVDPIRYSVFEDKEWIDTLENPETFLPAAQKGLEFATVDMKMPGATELYSVLTIHVLEALKGSLSPKEALDKVAKEWRESIKRRGFERQKELYRIDRKTYLPAGS